MTIDWKVIHGGWNRHAGDAVAAAAVFVGDRLLDGLPSVYEPAGVPGGTPTWGVLLTPLEELRPTGRTTSYGGGPQPVQYFTEYAR